MKKDSCKNVPENLKLHFLCSVCFISFILFVLKTTNMYFDLTYHYYTNLYVFILWLKFQRNKTNKALVQFIAAHKGVVLSAYVSIWTESHKICKAWVLINQILPQCFCYYGLWLNKSNHQVKQVDISESTDINQSISMNRFYSIEALIFIQKFFVFL